METLLVTAVKFIAGGGAAGGLMVLYKHFFLDRKQRQEAQDKLIDTLQKMAIDNLDKITNLQKDVDYWRRENNELSKSTNDLREKYEQALHDNETLKKQFHNLQKQYTELKKKYDELKKDRE